MYLVIYSGPYQDYIGSIDEKLKQNNLENESLEIDVNKAFDTKEIRGVFTATYDTFASKVEEQKDQQKKDQRDAYPYRKRFISMIDRRESKNDDKKGDKV